MYGVPTFEDCKRAGFHWQGQDFIVLSIQHFSDRWIVLLIAVTNVGYKLELPADFGFAKQNRGDEIALVEVPTIVISGHVDSDVETSKTVGVPIKNWHFQDSGDKSEQLL